ncbi:MAG: hypothetical protein MK135_10215 [Polyangiaceae bacterium]|nr:hypothetical protein [Polyangiaceae bacterium]
MKALVMDWGIGGLPCFLHLGEALKSRSCAVSCFYFSDAGYRPYGLLSAEEMRCRVVEVVDYFTPDVLVIACNAASVRFAIDGLSLLRQGKTLVFGMAKAAGRGLRMLLNADSAESPSILLLGGRATVESGYFQNLLGERVQARVAQPLSALVERGLLDGPEVEVTLHKLLAPSHGENYPTERLLALCCTHYPALSPLIRQLYPELRLFDPMLGLVEEVVRWLDVQGGLVGASRGRALVSSSKNGQLFTTGSRGNLCMSAKVAFGYVVPSDQVHDCLPLRSTI